MQGVALVSGFACAFEARRCALKAAKTEEFEAMKEAAVTADVVDEISTSIYISEQQRRKEAEAILASSDASVEAAREALEAVYNNDLQPETTATTSENDTKEIELWWKVEAAQVQGKTTTWIIENILGKKGRKFSEGKKQLEELVKKFSEEGE
jgi:isopropylmalate/homocitrate/citramalate synthase